MSNDDGPAVRVVGRQVQTDPGVPRVWRLRNGQVIAKIRACKGYRRWLRETVRIGPLNSTGTDGRCHATA
ncbi:hypothetical protein [Amycolatopsis nalaikhensis]|uniref:Transposase n=1 Tax=Amycolatopsis nalaikhensis TaxID=715472 RepID=A0ABY8XCU0_9PSEU|nr:hypothetical protein [Amycolatopsis sp. 2-2]WIV52995.1 hypothetical protein QP939_29150 [Amycolatopsis sp. 2-2]